MVVEELADFKNPANWILAVESRYIELRVWFVSVWRRDGVVVWGELRGRWLDGECSEVFEHGVHFCIHGGLGLGKGSVILGEGGLSLGEFGDGLLKMFQCGLTGVMVWHSWPVVGRQVGPSWYEQPNKKLCYVLKVKGKG